MCNLYPFENKIAQPSLSLNVILLIHANGKVSMNNANIDSTQLQSKHSERGKYILNLSVPKIMQKYYQFQHNTLQINPVIVSIMFSLHENWSCIKNSLSKSNLQKMGIFTYSVAIYCAKHLEKNSLFQKKLK